MQINQLIAKANRHYPDGLLAACWDSEQQRAKDEDNGDTLALFIVRELVDTYDSWGTDEGNLSDACLALRTAARHLEELAEGLENE